VTRFVCLAALGPLRFVAPYDPAAAVARILAAHGILDDPHDYVAELAALLDEAGAVVRFMPWSAGVSLR